MSDEAVECVIAQGETLPKGDRSAEALAVLQRPLALGRQQAPARNGNGSALAKRNGNEESLVAFVLGAGAALAGQHKVHDPPLPLSMGEVRSRYLANTERRRIGKTETRTVTKDHDSELCCSSLVDAPLGEAEASELARTLSALADPVRLRLLSLVASRELRSCELEEPLGKSQPTVSQHTTILVKAGLLVGEKRGRWKWWRVEPTRLASVRRVLGALTGPSVGPCLFQPVTRPTFGLRPRPHPVSD